MEPVAVAAIGLDEEWSSEEEDRSTFDWLLLLRLDNNPLPTVLRTVDDRNAAVEQSILWFTFGPLLDEGLSSESSLMAADDVYLLDSLNIEAEEAEMPSEPLFLL